MSLRIVVGAVISLTPYTPGIAWDWMQLAVGLRRLGHDVYYLEEVAPEWCVDERGDRCLLDRSVNRRLFRQTMQRFGFEDRAFQMRGDDQGPLDGPLETLLAGRPDLLINMAGHVHSRRVLDRVERRAYVDQDPVYTQLWCAEYGSDLNFAAHDVFLSVGLNIGTSSCIPDCGLEWHPVLPAVVPALWPVRSTLAGAHLTTIASWGGFGDLCYRGEWYSSKCVEFERFAELPRHVGQPLEVALRRHRVDDPRVRHLVANGWLLSSATDISTLTAYQRFIARSHAEIGIAKHAYVKARSGWFSDRAAHYLASGRPVLAQATGFEEKLPTGRGVIAFGNMDEAITGIEAITRDYDRHCRAARDFADSYLDYRRVIPPMLEVCTA